MNRETLNIWETKPRGVEAILFTKDSVAETVEFIDSWGREEGDAEACEDYLEHVRASGKVMIPVQGGVTVIAFFGEYIFRTDKGFWHCSAEEFESKHTLDGYNGWRPISEYDLHAGKVVEMRDEYIMYNGYRTTNGIFYIWEKTWEAKLIANPTHFRIP